METTSNVCQFSHLTYNFSNTALFMLVLNLLLYVFPQCRHSVQSHCKQICSFCIFHCRDLPIAGTMSLLSQLPYTYSVVLCLCCWALERCKLGISHSLRNCRLLRILHSCTESRKICYCKARVCHMRQPFD